MSLQNLQAELAEIILSDDHSTELAHPSQHLSIYRNNITKSLVTVLQDIYPLIAQLLGEDFFCVTAQDYIKRYPSRSGNLHDYGEYFHDFLSEYSPVEHLLYLSEVAKFEWACYGLNFAADHPSMDMKLLETYSPDQYEQLRFNLHPASQLIQFEYPLLRIIELCKSEINETIDLDEGGVNLLIIRRDLDVMLAPLTAAEYVFLTSLNQGNALSIALDAAINIDADFNLEEKLPGWIQDKTLVDCYVIS